MAIETQPSHAVATSPGGGMSGKTRGYAYDVDAWVQFHLLRLASFHAETTKADLAVLAEIIQRYWGKYGNGWVTHEKLGVMAGVSKATVIRAKRNLERLGFVTVVQAGRRGSATVYQPNFGLVPAKGSKDDTETLGVTYATETDDIGSIEATETPQYGVTDDTPSYLQDRPTRAGSQIDRVECATPTAPLADGPEATAARTAQGFDRLWNAYAHRQRKADARTAFEKLSPDTELVDRMVLAAEVWFAAWSAQNKPDAPRYTLARWIDREEYECAPPTAYKAKERKPRVPTETAPQPQAADLAMVGEISPFSSVGTFHAEIYEAEVKSIDPYTKRLTLRIELGDGTKTFHKFNVQAADLKEQERGRAMLSSITDALQINNDIDDTDEMLFRPLQCTIGMGLGRFFISYATAPANDNHPMKAAA